MMPTMLRVMIESPFAGDVEGNTDYARRAMRDSLARGEAPFAPHLTYTQVLDDTIEHERRLGIEAGYAWAKTCDLVAFYIDRGFSAGVLEAFSALVVRSGGNRPFVLRSLSSGETRMRVLQDARAKLRPLCGRIMAMRPRYGLAAFGEHLEFEPGDVVEIELYSVAAHDVIAVQAVVVEDRGAPKVKATIPVTDQPGSISLGTVFFDRVTLQARR